jgi:polar amino acid transport system permease protein
MSEPLERFFIQHSKTFFIFNLLLIIFLLYLFQAIAYPNADFSSVLTKGNITFMLFGMEGELGGLMLTFIIALQVILFSFALGSLLGVARFSHIKIIKVPATIYIEFFRALPLIMIIFWIYFALPIVGSAILNTKVAPSALISVIISLTLFESAYIAEIVRAGLKSISKGQFEAAKTLGMTSLQTFTLIILPQAYRRMIPAIVSQFVSLFKDTSLIYIIGVVEFFRAATIINNRIYMSFEILSFVAIVYFICAFTLSKIAGQLEKKVAKQLHS